MVYLTKNICGINQVDQVDQVNQVDQVDQLNELAAAITVDLKDRTTGRSSPPPLNKKTVWMTERAPLLPI